MLPLLSCVHLLCGVVGAPDGEPQLNSRADSGTPLDPKRIHLVDAGPRHFLFRGNNPTVRGNGSSSYSFALAELTALVRAAAARECNVTLPSQIRVLDVDLENPTDPGYFAELGFWRNQPETVGALLRWPTYGTLLDVRRTPAALRGELVRSGKWAMSGDADHLADRLATLRSLVLDESAPPTVLYLHCNAGCDRTGEVVGAYAMTYLRYNVTTAMGEACRQCGRCPNYYATNSIGWWCLTLQEVHNRTLGPCADFAECKFGGDCTPIGPTRPAAGHCPSAGRSSSSAHEGAGEP